MRGATARSSIRQMNERIPRILSIKADVGIAARPVSGVRETYRTRVGQIEESNGLLDTGQGVADEPIGRHHADRVVVNDSKIRRATVRIPCETGSRYCRGFQVARKSRDASREWVPPSRQ